MIGSGCEIYKWNFMNTRDYVLKYHSLLLIAIYLTNHPKLYIQQKRIHFY